MVKHLISHKQQVSAQTQQYALLSANSMLICLASLLQSSLAQLSEYLSAKMSSLPQYLRSVKQREAECRDHRLYDHSK